MDCPRVVNLRQMLSTNVNISSDKTHILKNFVIELRARLKISASLSSLGNNASEATTNPASTNWRWWFSRNRNLERVALNGHSDHSLFL